MNEQITQVVDAFKSIPRLPSKIIKSPLLCLENAFNFGDNNYSLNVSGTPVTRYKAEFTGKQYKKKLLDEIEERHLKDVLDTSDVTGKLAKAKQAASNLLKRITKSMKFYQIDFQGPLPGQVIKASVGLEGKKFVLQIDGVSKHGVPESPSESYIVDIKFMGIDNGSGVFDQLDFSVDYTTLESGKDAIVYTIRELPRFLDQKKDKLSVYVDIVTLGDIKVTEEAPLEEPLNGPEEAPLEEPLNVPEEEPLEEPLNVPEE